MSEGDNPFGLTDEDLEWVEDYIAFYRLTHSKPEISVYDSSRPFDKKIYFNNGLIFKIKGGKVVAADITISDPQEGQEIIDFLVQCKNIKRLSFYIRCDFHLREDLPKINLNILELKEVQGFVDLSALGSVKSLKVTLGHSSGSHFLRTSGFPPVKRIYVKHFSDKIVFDEKSGIQRIRGEWAVICIRAKCPKLRMVSLKRSDFSVEVEKPFPILRKVSFYGGRDRPSIPEDLICNGRLTVLKLRLIGNNNLDKVWENRSLRHLSLIQITNPHIPSSIGDLSRLRELRLDRLGIKGVEPAIGTLWKLEHLNLSGNNLESLPSSFSRLKRLRSLMLDGNRFEEVPEVIRQMKRLEFLHIGGNPLHQLPEWLFDIPQLKIFADMIPITWEIPLEWRSKIVDDVPSKYRI